MTPGERARSSSSAAPASSAATSPTALLADPSDRRVTVYDNFSSGRRLALRRTTTTTRASRSCAATSTTSTALRAAMDGHDIVIHLASNPDIARGDDRPGDRLRPGHAAHPPRRRGDARAPRRAASLYASGSGVYGDLGEHRGRTRTTARSCRSRPTARQQAGRRGADLRRTAYMFGLHGARVPLRQRRRPPPDPRRRLRLRPPAASRTRRGSTILGDGSQSKSYIHVDDVVAAVLPAIARADGAVRGVQRRHRRLHHRDRDRRPGGRGRWASTRPTSTFEYTGGDRGWKGDVPIVRLDTDRIRALGWRAPGSSREALRAVDARDARRRRAGSLRERRRRGRLPRPRRRAQRGRSSRRPPAPAASTSDDVVDSCPASARRAGALRDAGLRCSSSSPTSPTSPAGTRRPGRGRRASTTASLAELRPRRRCVVCPHDDADGCDCRKPLPGHAPRRGRRLGRRPRRAASWSATAGATSRPGARAGVATVFVDRDYDEPPPDGARPRRRRAWPRRVPWIIESSTRRRGRRSDDRPSSDLTRQDLRRRRRHRRASPSSPPNPLIQGFTTNPTLMRKAGVDDYETFAHELLERRPGPADLVRGVLRRVRRDGAPGPQDRGVGRATSTSRSPSPTRAATPSHDLVRRLAADGVQLNVTGAADASSRSPAIAEALAGGRAALRLRVRRPHRRHRPRPGADHGARRSTRSGRSPASS